MGITYRTNGAWGAGKGSNLSAAEGDENIWELLGRITNLENNPATPISIDHFTVEGTMLTIVLTDGTEHGPFVLPIAQWRWTGAWLPAVQYFVGDIIENNGNIYFIRVQHVSGSEFDPELFTDEGQVYILILAKAAQPYDIGMFYNDVIQAGEGILMLHVAARAFDLPVNFDGSQAFLRVPTSTATVTLPIYLSRFGVGTDLIGLITFAPGDNLDGTGQFGVFSSIDTDNPVEVGVGDRVSIGESYEDDDTAEGLTVTIICTTPSL